MENQTVLAAKEKKRRDKKSSTEILSPATKGELKKNEKNSGMGVGRQWDR